MKFTKFGKALLMSALSAGVIVSITSCVQSYTVGYLYVTGTETSGSDGNGIITGFKIDHNTGYLHNINGMPVASGGANPVRAVLVQGSRFFYVLNRGVNKEGKALCTTADPCTGSNITQFAVGANGILTPQETFYTQGLNPFRMFADSTGSYLFVLDHDSIGADGLTPSSATNPNTNCAAALTGAKTCGDITVFSINATTGRLSLILDTAATGGSGATIPYFPVPSNPVDFVMFSSNVFTLNATTTQVNQTTGSYIGGSSYFSYSYSGGQLARNGTNLIPLGINAGTFITSAGSYAYVLDDEAPSPNSTGASSQILPFTLGTSGSLSAVTTGVVADDASQSNPTVLVQENKGTRFYVANQGDNVTTKATTAIGLVGYVLGSPYNPTPIGTTVPFGSGSSPQCMVEDPSNQFFYEANFSDSTVTGQMIDQVSGDLTPLSQSSKAPSQYTLTGQPTYCLVDGRTS